MITGMVESFREKEGKDRRRMERKMQFCLKICPPYRYI